MCRRASTLVLPDLQNNEGQHPINILIDSTGLKIFGAGEWRETKYRLKKRRQWRKLHLAIDRDSQAILAQELTIDQESDSAQIQPLLETLNGEISSITADTAYDGDAPIKQFCNTQVNMCILLFLLKNRQLFFCLL